MKRKSDVTSRRVYKHKTKCGKKKSLMGVKNIRSVVNKVLTRKIETKQSTSTTTDGTEIKHNDFVVLDPTVTFLKTVDGTGDPMVGVDNRIGDEITLKGISLMIELNESYSERFL